MPSDLAILSAAASQMFECTRDMSREAVVSLLSGLRDVSMRNIPVAGAAVGQVRSVAGMRAVVWAATLSCTGLSFACLSDSRVHGWRWGSAQAVAWPLLPPGAATQAPKLFALNRMVEVLLYNIARIYDLWAIFLRCVGARMGCGRAA